MSDRGDLETNEIQQQHNSVEQHVQQTDTQHQLNRVGQRVQHTEVPTVIDGSDAGSQALSVNTQLRRQELFGVGTTTKLNTVEGGTGDNNNQNNSNSETEHHQLVQ